MPDTNIRPLVTVIVPVYNVEKYLEECLTSIFKQTYNNLEILLIDDGSVDNSGNICEKWCNKDERFKYIKKNNEGLGPTRNVGIKNALGDYIVSIDADDIANINYIEILLKTAICFDADLTVCNYFCFENNDVQTARGCKYASLFAVLDTKEKKIDYMKGFPRASFWGKLYKKSLLTTNRLFQPATSAQDTAVLAQTIACADRIVTIPDMLYYYRTDNSSSITSTYNKLNDYSQIFEFTVSEMRRLGQFDYYNEGLLSILNYHLSCMLKRYSIASERRDKEIAFRQLFNSVFPEWQQKIGGKCFVYGSFNAEWTAQLCYSSILCTTKHIAFSSLISQFIGIECEYKGNKHKNNVRQKMIDNDFEQGLKKYIINEENAIFIDFMDETYDVLKTKNGRYITDSEAFCETEERGRYDFEVITFGSKKFIDLWEVACRAFAKWLKSQKEVPVFLLHMELVEDSKSQILNNMEQLFIKEYPTCHFISAQKLLYYTQKNHPFGNSSHNLNWELYRAFARKICLITRN